MTGQTTIIECLDCGWREAYSPDRTTCSHCGGPWRTAIYDYANIAAHLPEVLVSRPFNIWRYRELLPISQPDYNLSMGEGGTPLLKAASLGTILGCPNLYIKDERQGPTNSFKDRQAIVTIAALKESGITEMVLASTGNVAISYAAFAARAGIKVWAFLTSLVPAAKMREVALYGAQVIKVTGSYDQAKQVAADFARQRGLFIDQGSKTVSSVEAMKTIAFEISEQLGSYASPRQETPRWISPDWYIQSVSGGLGPLGVLKGFQEMHTMGWIGKLPRLGIIQAEGCSPMVQSHQKGLDIAEPVVSPRTVIATLATGDPGRTYTLLRKAILGEFGGAFTSVSDEEAYKAMHFLAKMEGISGEPAAAVAFAGLFKLVHEGQIQPDHTVVINCTGHTLPVEESILEPGWSRSVAAPAEPIPVPAPEEGLLSALSHVEVEKYPRILIADDHPDVRQLIRRILQSQGSYTLFEAADGREAVALARSERPDLLILDLMMPEMDGFSVIDSLQSTADTVHIPIIVITAKELTQEEKNRLRGRIQSLMQKGDFMSDELLDEVKSLVH